jgi:uncharacterized membrane protein YfcA
MPRLCTQGLMPELTLTSGFIILCALLMGGILKGAAGVGAPVVAVPVMAAFFDVRLAVLIMMVPNLMSNLWQIRKFRAHFLRQGFTWKYAVAGSIGALLGTFLLATLPVRALTMMVAIAVVAYVGLRIARPDFQLKHALAHRIVGPVGVIAGILQGAAGISAPVSVSFLNAMRLERPVFIATISTFFVAMSLAQLPTAFALGLLSPGLLGLSLAALIPILVAMPIGTWLATRLSPTGFDRLVLLLLTGLAMRLVYVAFTQV